MCKGGEGRGGDILMLDENCYKMVMVRCMHVCVEGGGGGDILMADENCFKMVMVC